MTDPLRPEVSAANWPPTENVSIDLQECLNNFARYIAQLDIFQKDALAMHVMKTNMAVNSHLTELVFTCFSGTNLVENSDQADFVFSLPKLSNHTSMQKPFHADTNGSYMFVGDVSTSLPSLFLFALFMRVPDLLVLKASCCYQRRVCISGFEVAITSWRSQTLCYTCHVFKLKLRSCVGQ